MRVFALLDDRDATHEQPSSRRYEDFAHDHRCSMWTRVDADLQHALQAVLQADYEWGAKLIGVGHVKLTASDTLALRVSMFHRLAHLACDDVDGWLMAQHQPPGASGVMAQQQSACRPAFTQAIEQIKEAIRTGETYQVNHTYRLNDHAYGTPVGLYCQLRQHQPAGYSAFIALPDDAQGITPVLSCSPELFLHHESGQLTAPLANGALPGVMRGLLLEAPLHGRPSSTASTVMTCSARKPSWSATPCAGP